MATLSELPGICDYIRRMVVDEHKTHQTISTELRRSYPMTRGTSERSVARFCAAYDATSRISDRELDIAVRSSRGMVSESM